MTTPSINTVTQNPGYAAPSEGGELSLLPDGRVLFLVILSLFILFCLAVSCATLSPLAYPPNHSSRTTRRPGRRIFAQSEGVLLGFWVDDSLAVIMSDEGSRGEVGTNECPASNPTQATQSIESPYINTRVPANRQVPSTADSLEDEFPDYHPPNSPPPPYVAHSIHNQAIR